METIIGDMVGLIQKVKETRLREGLGARTLGRQLGINETAIGKWERGERRPSEEKAKILIAWLSQTANKPSTAQMQLGPITTFSISQATNSTEQLRHLLNAIELNLRYFVNGSPQAREFYRDEIDLYDVNYIISVLESLFDEGKFQRWKMFSSYKFQGFRRQTHGRKRKNQSQSGQST